jgi:hypothetical protein
MMCIEKFIQDVHRKIYKGCASKNLYRMCIEKYKTCSNGVTTWNVKWCRKITETIFFVNGILTFLALELFILILAHPVYKM